MNRLLLAATLLICSTLPAQNPKAAKDPFQPLQFLLGTWVGEGSGDPGKGTGGFTIKSDLENHVLIRTNFAEYPATAERPAYRHDDLLITYSEGDALKAIYFDNEGHVIHYNVTASADGVVYVSEGPGPGFRLTYRAPDKDHLTLKFEIAPPGKPGEFRTYIEATAHRR